MMRRNKILHGLQSKIDLTVNRRFFYMRVITPNHFTCVIDEHINQYCSVEILHWTWKNMNLDESKLRQCVTTVLQSCLVSIIIMLKIDMACVEIIKLLNRLTIRAAYKAMFFWIQNGNVEAKMLGVNFYIISHNVWLWSDVKGMAY